MSFCVGSNSSYFRASLTKGLYLVRVRARLYVPVVVRCKRAVAEAGRRRSGFLLGVTDDIHGRAVAM